MATLNVVIGLGGTGQEIIEFFLRILKNYPLPKEETAVEVFLFDTQRFNNNAWFYKELNGGKWQGDGHRGSRCFRVEPFSDSKRVVDEISKNLGDDTNIGDIFKDEDPVIINGLGTGGDGAWYVRKLGYLSLFYYLYRNPDDNGIERIVRTVSFYRRDNEYSRFNIFIVNSMAGGTGSGMFMPLAGLLRNRLSDIEQLNIFSILISHDVLHKGARKVDDETARKFQFNTFQVFKEIEFLNPSRKKWFVKFNAVNTFNHERTLFDSIQIITEKNTQRAILSHDAYEPYFQMAAWGIYAFCSASDDAWTQLWTSLRGGSEYTNRISSFDLRVFEYPLMEAIRCYQTTLLRKFREVFVALPVDDGKGDAGPQQEASLLFKEIEKKVTEYVVKKEKDVKILETEFSRALNECGKNPQDLRDKSIPPSPYSQDERAELCKSAVDHLDGKILRLIQEKSLGFMVNLLECLVTKIDEKLKENEKEKGTVESEIETQKRNKDGLTKYKQILESQKDLFKRECKKYKLYQLIGIYNELKSICNARFKYITGIYDLFISRSTDWSQPIEIVKEYNPPLIGIVENIQKFVEEEIYKKIKDNTVPESKGLTKEERNREVDRVLIRDIWSYFESRTLRNKIYQSYEDKMNGRINWEEPTHDTSEKNALLQELKEKTIISYLREKRKEFSASQELVDYINKLKDDKLKNLAPFLSYINAGSSATPFLFLCDDHESLVDINHISGFDNLKKYTSSIDSNIIILMKLANAMRVSELDLKKSEEVYAQELKARQKEYKGNPLFNNADFRLLEFLDPQFSAESNDK